LTEFHLLKLVQRFGSIENFDFLFHRFGPNAGLPRGYAFITYNHAEDAKKCLEGLDGKKVLDKVLSVRYAHQTANVFTDEEEKLRKKLPALGMKPDSEVKPVSKERAISAIEAKLRAMEREKEEVSNFSLTVVGGGQKGNVKSQSTTRNYPYANKSSTTQYDTRSRPKPYSRFPPHKRF
jgi:RNA recognition motif-containing protein